MCRPVLPSRVRPSPQLLYGPITQSSRLHPGNCSARDDVELPPGVRFTFDDSVR